MAGPCGEEREAPDLQSRNWLVMGGWGGQSHVTWTVSGQSTYTTAATAGGSFTGLGRTSSWREASLRPCSFHGPDSRLSISASTPIGSPNSVSRARPSPCTLIEGEASKASSERLTTLYRGANNIDQFLGRIPYPNSFKTSRPTVHQRIYNQTLIQPDGLVNKENSARRPFVHLRTIKFDSVPP
jgi:hypothetical protein